MNTNNTQQERSYYDFVQNFSSLFKKIKEEDESIYTAVAGFNIIKFLIERSASWSTSDNSQHVYGAFKKEFKNMKEAKQKLQGKAKEVLSKYIENDVEEVSIYGSCAEIRLKADKDKNEFKISEFLNSDFCEKNRISGFSTLHDNGKSGMHGFVSKEGIRHYVVTDGSYEMTLKWYVEGKECEITINIDAEGIDLIKGDDFALKRLKANRDVKIGGLFLDQIEFRNREQEKEVQHGKGGRDKSSEIITENSGRDISVQATQMNRGVEPQKWNNFPNLRLLSEESSGNKRTPPPLPPGTSSLKKNILNEQEGTKSLSHQNDRQSELGSNTDDIAQKRFSENVLKKIEDIGKPIYKWLKDKIEGKENNQNLDALEKKLSQKSDIVKKRENDNEKGGNQALSVSNPNNPFVLNANNPFLAEASNRNSNNPFLSQIGTKADGSNKESIDEEMLKNVEEFQANPSKNSLRTTRQQDNRGLRKVDLTHKPLQDKEDRFLKDSSIDVKTEAASTISEQSFHSSITDSKSDSGYSSPTDANRGQSQVNLEQLRSLLTNIEQSKQKPEKEEPNTPFKELEQRLNQRNYGLKQIDPKHYVSPQTKKHLIEAGLLLKESLTDVKTNDSSYSFPTHTEFTSKLDKETKKFPLKLVDQNGMSEQTKKHLLAAGLLKDNSTDMKTVAEQENADTNTTIDKNSNLYKLLEKDAAQLKIGVIEEEREDISAEYTDSYDRNRVALANRNRRPLNWTKRVAEQQQEKDAKGTSIMSKG